ncbi:hypothetical protein BN903_216 [Halorubrum sp. AJ67]|nr:hypothetical protein BN903_216 [Halorubrum sp. AJ67]
MNTYLPNYFNFVEAVTVNEWFRSFASHGLSASKYDRTIDTNVFNRHL